MTQREQRRAALCRLIARKQYRTLGELRLQLAVIEGHHVSVPQLFKDCMAIGAWREAYWTIDPKELTK